MGNECCISRKKNPGSLFTDQEEENLERLYDSLIGPKRTKGKTKFNKLTLNQLFQENPDIASLIYKFMTSISKEENVDFKSFELALELLTHDPNKCQYTDYRNLEKIEILAFATIGDFTQTKENLKTLKISYAQALDFIKNLLKIFNYNITIPRQIDDYAAKVAVDGAFRQEQGEINWWSFLSYIQENMSYVNPSLKAYFNAKFLGKKVDLKVPEPTRASLLLSPDLTSLLYLSNIYLHTINRLEFLYSSRYEGPSFDQIAEVLDGYPAPTYIFFRVEPIREAGVYNGETSYIIGGFSRSPWKNTGELSGDQDCFVFSLAPKFRNYYAIDKSGNHNFTYLKSKSYKQGLGFGGRNERDFRIWIDGTDLNQSYVRSEDEVYASGELVGPGYTRIRILEVEIWGFGIEIFSIKDNKQNNTEEMKIVYNQSKILEITSDSTQVAKMINQFENKSVQNSPFDDSYQRSYQGGPYRSPNAEFKAEESYKQSYFSPPRQFNEANGYNLLKEPGVYSEYENKAIFPGNSDGSSYQRSTFTTSYNYQNDLGTYGNLPGRSTYSTSYDTYQPKY